MFHTSNSIRTSGTICWKTNPDIGMMKKQSIPDKNPQYFARAVTGHKNLEKEKGKIIIVYIVTYCCLTGDA